MLCVFFYRSLIVLAYIITNNHARHTYVQIVLFVLQVFRQLLPVVSLSADDVARTSTVTVPPVLVAVAHHAVEFVG